MNIAAIGRTETLYDSILAASDAGHDISLIITTDAEPEYERDSEDFRQLAEQLGSSFHHTKQINSPEIVSEIRRLSPKLAISINWKTIIGEEVLNSFEYGILNSHAGDLPRYRGNAAPNWAMIHDETEVVFTIHQMDNGLDSGPIVLQRSIPLTPETLIGDIYDFARNNVPNMFVESIDGLQSGEIEPTPQPDDPRKAVRCYPRIPKDSEIQWEKSAAFLDRLVRASSEPFAGAYTWLDSEKLTIWRAHPEIPEKTTVGSPGQIAELRPDTGTVAVLTGNGFLVLEEVETATRGRCEPTDVITSHRTRLGMDLTGKLSELEERIDSLQNRTETDQQR